MSIQRYYPVAVITSRKTTAQMQSHARGEYVTYESHAEELHRVQGELDALKESLKRQIFAPLEKAMMNALIQTAMMATQTSLKVNPCEKLAAEWAQELKGNGGSIMAVDDVERGFATGGIIRSGSVYLGGQLMTMSISDPEPEPKVLLCIKSDAKSFTAGKKYEYETRGGDLFLAQDDFVSDLNEDDFWHVTDGGAYYIVEAGSGNAYFKK